MDLNAILHEKKKTKTKAKTKRKKNIFIQYPKVLLILEPQFLWDASTKNLSLFKLFKVTVLEKNVPTDK